MSTKAKHAEERSVLLIVTRRRMLGTFSPSQKVHERTSPCLENRTGSVRHNLQPQLIELSLNLNVRASTTGKTVARVEYIAVERAGQGSNNHAFSLGQLKAMLAEKLCIAVALPVGMGDDCVEKHQPSVASEELLLVADDGRLKQ